MTQQVKRETLLRELEAVQPGTTTRELLEQWVSARLYEGIYMVSNMGNVRSVDRICKRDYNGDARRKSIAMKQKLDNRYMKVATCFQNGVAEPSNR